MHLGLASGLRTHAYLMLQGSHSDQQLAVFTFQQCQLNKSSHNLKLTCTTYNNIFLIQTFNSQAYITHLIANV